MPVTITTGDMKYRDDQGVYHNITGLKGDKGDPGDPGSPGDPAELIDDTSTTAENRTWSAKKLNSAIGAKVGDVQINGTSVVGQGGTASIPVASDDDYGVCKVTSTYGIYVTPTGDLCTVAAPESVIKPIYEDASSIMQQRMNYRPIVPAHLNEAVFYGLAKSAGDTTQASSSNIVGNYTETAQSKINDMLNAPVYVSGTTPSITGKSGIRYVCGEVATLSITPPQTGCIDVVFTSGSTPTVLTVPNTVKFPAWFNPSALVANTTYEVNILDGTLGTVMAWA